MKTLEDISERIKYYIENHEYDPTQHRSKFLCRFLDKPSIYKILCSCKDMNAIIKENWIPEIFSYNVIKSIKNLYEENRNFDGIVIYEECCWILEDLNEKTNID